MRDKRFVKVIDELEKDLDFEVIKPDNRDIPLSRHMKIWFHILIKSLITYFIIVAVSIAVILISLLVFICFYGAN